MWLYPVPISIWPGRGGGACNRELRRIPLPRTSVNKGKRKGGAYTLCRSTLCACWSWYACACEGSWPTHETTLREALRTANITALLLARYVGTACRSTDIWVGAQTAAEPVAGALTPRPLTNTQCALRAWRELPSTELDAGVVSALLCQSHPRNGGQHTTNEGAAHPPKRPTTRDAATGQSSR
jgi:hypothetical protein